MRPSRPAVDHLHGSAVGAADEKILGPQSLPMGEIKNELARRCGHSWSQIK
jgi:hypothetical protein